jgi:predicted membrane channel-forming protein YqfA (hemolysin III family)
LDNAEKTRYELSEWFIEISPRRKTTKILLKIYRYFLIPEYICVVLAIVGSFTSLFDQLLNHVLGIALICLILCAGIFGGIVAKLFK